MAQNKVLEDIGRAFIPKAFRGPLNDYALKAGYEELPYPTFAIVFFVAALTTVVLHFLFLAPRLAAYGAIETLLWVLGFWLLVLGGLCVLAMFFVWSFFNLSIYRRTKAMEEKLPDYLSLVVTNLKSGMSFDKSLWSAIRPEFGVLAKEIGMVSKKVMTGNETGAALSEFAKRYDSPILRRSISLIVSEIQSGGEIAVVIERVIENLRKTSTLKREMAASVVSYMMFIGIIVMVLAPVLFALANTILEVILEFAGQIAAAPSGNFQGGAAQVLESLGNLAETGDTLTANFRIFSFMALGTIALFSSMIVSIIEKGDIRGGIKYIPVFISVSLFIFWMADKVLQNVFGALV